MNWKMVVGRELLERKSKLATGLLAIILGIAVIVAIDNISFYSEKAVAKELDSLGANILVLPKEATVENYYRADLGAGEIPEEYLTVLTGSDLQGLDNLSPKLSMSVRMQNRDVTLTGILPKNEFQSKLSWQGAGIFSRPQGCGDVKDIFGLTKASAKETLVRKRVIETLESHEVLVGSDVAAIMHIKEGETASILGESFSVIAILPQTGTIDDSRIFAHLHTVQDLAKTGPVVNAIEVVGCCQEIAGGLVTKINHLLPDAKVVTIQQIVETQIKTHTIMERLSLLFLVIIAFVGAATIANDMYGNVMERKREIGTLVALGASPWDIQKVFLLKAVYLGFLGGVCGFLLGTVMAVILGPIIADVPVLPMPFLFVGAVACSVCVAFAASFFPSYYASRLDPCTILQEV